MTVKKIGCCLLPGLLVFSLVLIQPAGSHVTGPVQDPPLWWEIVLDLRTQGEYRLEESGRRFLGNYTFAIRWLGCMERDDDDYVLYPLDCELRTWDAQETASASNTLAFFTTSDFRDRPSFIFNYIFRQGHELHLDFNVSGIVIPQPESADSALLLFPASAENNQHDNEMSYNNFVTKGSNRIALEETEIYAGRLERTYSWTWKNERWTLKQQQTIFTSHSHEVEVKLTIIPHQTQTDKIR
jgi:hypothetical protein